MYATDAHPPLGEPDVVVAGVVVHLSHDEALRTRALAELTAHPALTMGEAVGNLLPLVVEAGEARDGRDLHAWLATVPGVEWVEVVSVHFGSDGDPVIRPQQVHPLSAR